MAGKRTSRSKQSARKKNGALKDLSNRSQDLTDRQAKAVKGGGDMVITKNTDSSSPPLARN